MNGILKLIDSALADVLSDKEISDRVNAIQVENIREMERRARTMAELVDRPRVLLDGEVAWFLGKGRGRIHKYAVMTHGGAVREVILSSSFPKPRCL